MDRHGGGVNLRRTSLAPPPMLSPRKYSLPVPHHPVNASGYRRKLSQVSQAVSQTLSTAWKGSVSEEEVVDQARNMCGRLLRARLQRACPLLHRKLGLQRLKSVTALGSGAPPPAKETTREMRLLCAELEARYPSLFDSVVRNAGVRALPTLASARDLFKSVAREIFRHGDISWGRIVALYAITGVLAVDCVQMGHPEYVLALVREVEDFVRKELSSWICQHGGWAGLMQFFQGKPSLLSKTQVVLITLTILTTSLFFISLLLN